MLNYRIFISPDDEHRLRVENYAIDRSVDGSGERSGARALELRSAGVQWKRPRAGRTGAVPARPGDAPVRARSQDTASGGRRGQGGTRALTQPSSAATRPSP